MADLLAAPPDPRNDLTRHARSANRATRWHIARPGVDRCGRALLDVARAKPAADVPAEQRCQATKCRAHWPETARG